MTEKLLDIIRAKHELSPLEVGEFVSLKAKGMRFSIRAFRAEGLGHVSVMRARGFFGLMRMDTLMIVPEQKDLPLYSYDRIHAMGNDTLIIELYDTTVKNNLDMFIFKGKTVCGKSAVNSASFGVFRILVPQPIGCIAEGRHLCVEQSIKVRIV